MPASNDERARQREEEFLTLLRRGGTVSAAGLFDSGEPGCAACYRSARIHSRRQRSEPTAAGAVTAAAGAGGASRLITCQSRVAHAVADLGFLRQVSGDDAYERYHAHGPGASGAAL